MWAEIGYNDGSTPYPWLSSIALPPWLPGIPSHACPTAVPSLMSPWAVSLQSTADLSLGLLLNPCTPAPSLCVFEGTCIPVWGMYGCSKDCLCDSCSVWTVTGQLLHSEPQIFLLCPKQLPWYVDQTPASVPQPAPPQPPTHTDTKGRSSPVNPPFFLPTSFVLASFVWFYIFFQMVRYSCLLSAGVLQAFLYLKVYSWCTHGETCIPHPPTPLPSFSI